MRSTKSINTRFSYPFAAVVGMSFTKRALMLLAVDPMLKGVVIAAASGTAKSVLGKSVAEVFPFSAGKCPFVEVPLNVSEERLFGGFDIDYAFSTGESRIDSGLINRANGGILYIDNISLLDARLSNQLMSVIDEGSHQIERDGISASIDSEFVIIGSFNPEEQELHRGLLDRVGLIVSEPEVLSSDERAELVRRRLEFDMDPESFGQRFDDRTKRLRDSIEAATKRLPTVIISDDDRRRLSAAALGIGIEGSRAEIFAIRAARANAAFESRDRVTDEDLKLAVQMTLIPRALIAPEIAMQPDSQETQRNRNTNESKKTGQSQDDSSTESTETMSPSAMEDLVVEALNGELPDDLEALWRSKHGEYGRSQLRRGWSARHRNAIQKAGEKRGRHVRSTQFAKNKSSVDLFATLNAAALHQRSRRARDPLKGSRVLIEKRDLRFKQFKQKIGSLFIFVVDASGSMALNRMNQAKGALGSLLQRSYLNRDKVALIAFRKDKAEILLPPSQSVALAKRAVDSMPVGGSTPLAAGLVAALEMAMRARQSGIAQTPIVLFTDGRANVSIDGTRREVQSQIEKIAIEFRRQGIPSVVIDTHLKFTSSGDGERLANMLGGRYSYLPRADAKSLVNLIRAETER